MCTWLRRLLFLTTFFGVTTHAQPQGRLGPAPGEDRSVIQVFRDGRQVIPHASACEAVLLSAQAEVGRVLTVDEIRRNLPGILNATGEKLVPEPPNDFPQFAHPEVACFTGEMMVATPKKERRIADLKAGDEVVSIDLRSGQRFSNQIKEIRSYEERPYGKLWDLPRGIDVTERHRFLARDVNRDLGFYAIKDLSVDAQLFIANPKTGDLQAVVRGCYTPQRRDATVFDMELTGEPRNYIVNGVLVHNIKF